MKKLNPVNFTELNAGKSLYALCSDLKVQFYATHTLTQIKVTSLSKSDLIVYLNILFVMKYQCLILNRFY